MCPNNTYPFHREIRGATSPPTPLIEKIECDANNLSEPTSTATILNGDVVYLPPASRSHSVRGVIVPTNIPAVYYDSISKTKRVKLSFGFIKEEEDLLLTREWDHQAVRTPSTASSSPQHVHLNPINILS